MFYLYCVQQVLEQDAGDRDLWNQLFVSLQDSFDGSVPPLVLVDTDGTGKTLLFFKALIEHSARRTGVTVDVDVLMGAQRPNNLGIPNLGSKFVPDIHWPFMFDRHELEPIFTFEQSPTKLLSLLFESLARYNRAVDDSRAAQAASMPW
jgi:hypothetical protein